MVLDESISRLRSNKQIIIDLVSDIPQDQATWKPATDRWSILEVVRHLIDIETEDFRTDLDIVLFHPETSWPNFNIHDWLVGRKYNEQQLDESVELFSDERDASISWLNGLAEPDFDAAHSGNGWGGDPMKAGDVLASWLAHDLGHIRQLATLRYDILKSFSGYDPGYSGFEA